MRLVVFVQLLLLCAPASAAGQRGQEIYTGQCAICHGQRGEGGRGPSLTRAKLRHAQDDAALQRVIRRGIAGTGMPATWLNESELLDVAAHVRSFARAAGVAEAPLPGNRTRGQEIYAGKGGCARCHTINGQGGAFGPDLTGIGSRRSAAHLTASILDPAADIPPGFLLINAVSAASGRTTIGARVNEDTFSVQLRDASGTLHSFWKTELRQLRKEPGKTGMPSFRGALTAAELEDVVAYLAGLEDAP